MRDFAEDVMVVRRKFESGELHGGDTVVCAGRQYTIQELPKNDRSGFRYRLVPYVEFTIVKVDPDAKQTENPS